jgi:hypothetical protein
MGGCSEIRVRKIAQPDQLAVIYGASSAARISAARRRPSGRSGVSKVKGA